MQRFAFIIHPIDAKRDVGRKYPVAKVLPERLIEWYIKRRDPIVVADVVGVRSITGEEARGWFIGCPLTPRQMMELPIEFVYDKLEKVLSDCSGPRRGDIGLGAFHIGCWRRRGLRSLAECPVSQSLPVIRILLRRRLRVLRKRPR